MEQDDELAGKWAAFPGKLLTALAISDERVLGLRVQRGYRGDMMLTLEVGDDLRDGGYRVAFGGRVITTQRTYGIFTRVGGCPAHRLARALLAHFGLHFVHEPCFALIYEGEDVRLELENLVGEVDAVPPAAMTWPPFWELLVEYEALPFSSAAAPMVPTLTVAATPA